MAEQIGEYYVKINADTKGADAGINSTKVKVETLGTAGQQAGAGISQGMATASKSFLSTAITAASVTLAIREIVKVLKDVINAAMESRVAAAGMSAALKAQGRDVGVMLPQYRALATQMQDIAGVSDEVALNVEKELVLRGKTFNEIKRAMPLWANMVASGMDAAGAQKVIEQILEGQPSMLERTNAKLREMREAGASVEAIIAQLSKDYAGQAEEITKAKLGIDQLKERWGDVKEAIGEVNTGPIANMIKMLNEALITIQRIIRASSGISISTMSLDEIQAAREAAKALIQQAYSGNRPQGRFSTYLQLSNPETDQYFISRSELAALEGKFGKLDKYITEVQNNLVTDLQFNTGAFIDDLDAQRAVIQGQIDLERQLKPLQEDVSPAGTSGGGNTTQYLDDWERIDSLVKNHAMSLGEAASQMAALYAQDVLDRDAILAKIEADGRENEEQKKKLDLIEQHNRAYTAMLDAESQEISNLTAGNHELHKHVMTTKQIAAGQEKINKNIIQTKSFLEDTKKIIDQFFPEMSKVSQSVMDLISASARLSEAKGMESAATDAKSMQAAMTATKSASLGTAVAAIAVADAVSEAAYSMYETVQETGDWGEALQNTVLGALKQIPVVGKWLALLVDKIWVTATEKQEEYNDKLSYAEKLTQYQAAVSGDVAAAKQNELDIVNDELSRASELGLTDEEILDLKIKQAGLENDITEEVKKQAEAAEANYRAILKMYDTMAGFASTASDWYEQTGQYLAAIEAAEWELESLQTAQNLLQRDSATFSEDHWNLQNKILDTQMKLVKLKEQQYEDSNNILEAEIAYQEALNGGNRTAETAAKIKAAKQKEIANTAEEIAILEEKIAQLTSDGAKSAELEVELWNKKTNQLKLQNDLIQDQIDLIKGLAGYIDVQNVIDVQTIQRGLQTAGVSGLALNDALSGMGITGANAGSPVTTSTVGTLINNYYNTTTAGDENIDG